MKTTHEFDRSPGQSSKYLGDEDDTFVCVFFFWNPLTLSFRSEGEALHVFSRGPMPPPF